MNPLEDIRSEIARLENLKRAIQEQITVLRESEKALEPVYLKHRPVSVLDAFPDREAGLDLGMTERVRKVLSTRYPDLTFPIQIRNILVSSGQVDASRRSNFLAEVHAILRRLLSQGEVEAVESGEKTGYRVAVPYSRILQTLAGVPPPNYGAPDSLATKVANQMLKGKTKGKE